MCRALAARSALQSTTRRIHPRYGTSWAVPPRDRMPFAEKCAAAACVYASFLAVPLYVIYNLPYYGDPHNFDRAAFWEAKKLPYYLPEEE